MNPLKGKTIVVTRPRDQSEEFVKRLNALGATGIVFPTIEIAPPESWKECDAAIGKLDSYHAVVFASLNAVDFFFSRIKERHLQTLKKRLVYVVGEKTFSAVAKHGIMPARPSDVHDGSHLAEKLLADGVKGKRFLLPKGNLGRETVRAELVKHGALVDEVTVYRTIIPAVSDAEKIKDLLSRGKIDVMTFFSPSSVENCMALIPPSSFSSMAVAAIGKTTAEAVGKAGLTVQVIAHPSTSEGMMDALQKYFEKRV